MIPFNNALSIVLSHTTTFGKEILNLEDALGAVLASNIKTNHDIPFFDNSAVDGFGIKIKDIEKTPGELKLIAIVKAGDQPKTKCYPGTTIKILTGAPIPPGVEAVVMKEFCEEENGFVKIKKQVSCGDNIRKKGEEFKKGTTVLPSGTRITPPVIGLLATIGYNKCLVYKKPRIAVIATGSELIKVGKKLKCGKIYESNSYAISACLKELRINHNVSWVSDNKKALQKKISEALKSYDVIITIGGISVGDYDFVKDIVQTLGVKTIFTKVAMKPAKPNYFGVLYKNKKKELIFGLPGNPVSALVSFHQIIKPALLKMIGAKITKSINISGTLSSTLKKKAGRLEFVRGFIEGHNGKLLVIPTKGQGSHMLGGIANANCLIYFPKEKAFLPSGSKVEVELLNWR